MAINKETVSYVAHLARIELKSAELEKLSLQLQDIVNFIDKLKNLDVKEVKPAYHILSLNNVLRDDSSKPSLPLEKTLENAPQRVGEFFGVPKVIE